jgi:hypothetical protein
MPARARDSSVRPAPRLPGTRYQAEDRMEKLRTRGTRILEEAGAGLKALEEEVITTRFDPDDPASVQAAIEHIEHAIDVTTAPFRGNRLVEEAADQIKAECRAWILQQVTNPDIDRVAEPFI